MKLKADEIASVIKQEISRYRAELDVAEVGRVLEVGDGVARIYGLASAMAGEMLEFENGAVGPGLQPRRELRSAPSSSATTSTSRRATRSARPAACSGARRRRRSSAAWSTRSAGPLDGKGPIAVRRTAGRWRSSPPASPSASR